MITIIGATHPGRREHNEDCFTADSSTGLGLIADGMGGYAGGDLASELVKTTIEEAVSKQQGLQEAIARAHSVVRQRAAEDTARHGMGSTVIVLKTQGFDYQIAWVGDSRAYLWDEYGVLKQVTRDHSYVESLLASGAITYQESLCHPNRNLITQAVGVNIEKDLDIGLIGGRLASGQKLLLCSDGLVDEVSDKDIAGIIHRSANSEEAIKQLIAAALQAGGRDNITVVIATAEGGGSNELPAIEPEVIRSSALGCSANAGLPESLSMDKEKACVGNNMATLSTGISAAAAISKPRIYSLAWRTWLALVASLLLFYIAGA